MILLTASFKFRWPTIVEEFFSVSKPISQVSEQILSFDCFLGQTSTSLDKSDDYFRVYYIKLLMMALLPITLFMICYTVWGIYSWKVKDFSNLKNRAISSVVILLFLFHPNIVQYMFGSFK